MLEWLSDNEILLTWLSLISLATFIISLLALPWLVSLIPGDYFQYQDRHATALKKRHPVIRLMLLCGKNLLGVVLLCGGLLMLFLPGQGLLTMAVGMLLMDYPGKFHLERRIVGHPSVLKSINWLRAKRSRPPIEL